ncbi:cAMP and cAMP-inhibited cGMP 3',5'-cyclic phosphodiesterase 10A-like [Mizuhopecten yessoensis]|uniref:Phosphodiesterase n=1 Tax=Mizuhopecten yessoensis TaxID=6573 RepID=A0A210PI87_MIZYE|nr:cAMP and cAMP-inhibited cGMP 3',5'-cyclic phosphodiesterase 10A-like [Mizuhopecten yessoensis]OWF36193.1 cAMP and cAMP-inhibited cGMP 3',5'-cyclic phosphodiesterase 10A [Mizuhopecten yessoensis]
MSRNSFMLSLTKKSPFPGNMSTNRWSDLCSPRITELDVKIFLENNPSVFRRYVMDSINVDTLEELIKRKRRATSCRVTKRHKALLGDYDLLSTKDVASKLLESVNANNLLSRMEELSKILAQAVNGDSHSLYVPKNNDTELHIFRGGVTIPYGPTGKGSTVAAHAFNTRASLTVSDMSLELARFPKGTGPGEAIDVSVLCVPLILPSDDIIGVIEVVRNSKKYPFSRTDIQMAHALLSWMVACISENNVKRVLDSQRHLNDFLLDTTRIIFDEMTSTDLLVQKIMMFTKNLVNADRCSLFLVDEETNELYADYFDEGKKTTDGQSIISKKSQIRFSRDKGIAGYVARSGEVLNILDAYMDSRFNREVDKLTGYRTRNILCMPIVSKDQVVGVVQLINSLRGEHFTNADESAFKMFSVYCAMALHYSRLYNLLVRQQNQYKVALEVIQYHIVCKEEEMKELVSDPFIQEESIPYDFFSFDFCAYDFAPLLPQLFIHMVIDMFGEDTFEMEQLCRFTITVRKNYRDIAYHNWDHGFHVAHSLWCMMRESPNVFTKFEQMAILISGICHDVDHRGYNNAFFSKMDLPLASLYSTSVMEQHHYKHTVTILQMDGQGIFSFLTATEYKEMLGMVQHCILATDLALYFPNQKAITKQLDESTFDLQETAAKKQAIALMMTGADLCAISKPWETQGVTVDFLYEEFYDQGDLEKSHGIEPLPMMDRERITERPQQQVGFIDFICHPLYKTLHRILPGAKPLLDGCSKSREDWAQVLAQCTEEERKRKEEEKKEEVEKEEDETSENRETDTRSDEEETTVDES